MKIKSKGSGLVLLYPISAYLNLFQVKAYQGSSSELYRDALELQHERIPFKPKGSYATVKITVWLVCL